MIYLSFKKICDNYLLYNYIQFTIYFRGNLTAMKTYMCLICGFIYDEALGRPEDNIAPGTKWEDVPMNWTCPECEARKEDFEIVEI